METKQNPVKIEFKKITDASGTYYYTAVNGLSVTNSWNMVKEDAYNFFLKVVERGGDMEKVEILETVELKKVNN